MAEQNRVTPLGEIVAVPLRGAWTGNRGVLHEGGSASEGRGGHRIVRSHASDLWITCALEFRGRWREQWLPHRYTHLFFHDEAVSFAAGHRPCAECRRGDYRAYQQAWAAAGAPVITARSPAGHGTPLITARSPAGHGTPDLAPASVPVAAPLPSAKQMNAQLHSERIVPGTHQRRLHELPWAGLPDGTFVLDDGQPALVLGDALVPWTTDGYGDRRPRPTAGTATVITPPSTVAVLRAGYPVQIDDTAKS
jgi:hypothetical protein